MVPQYQKDLVLFHGTRKFTEVLQMMWFFYIEAHTGANRLIYPYQYTLTKLVTCSIQLCVIQ